MQHSRERTYKIGHFVSPAIADSIITAIGWLVGIRGRWFSKRATIESRDPINQPTTGLHGRRTICMVVEGNESTFSNVARGLRRERWERTTLRTIGQSDPGTQLRENNRSGGYVLCVHWDSIDLLRISHPLVRPRILLCVCTIPRVLSLTWTILFSPQEWERKRERGENLPFFF